jgi:hypothetical protein
MIRTASMSRATAATTTRTTSDRRPRRIGTALRILAAVSAAVGLLFHRDAARQIVEDGVWNAVPDAAADREAALWYIAAGLALVPLAGATHRLERAGAASRGRVGIGLVGLGVGGGIAKPASPFWVFAGIGWLLVRRTPEAGAGRPVAGRALGVIALVHLLAVGAFYPDGAQAIVRHGVERSAAEPDALFWWLSTAGTLGLLGEAVRAGTHPSGGRSDVAA